MTKSFDTFQSSNPPEQQQSGRYQDAVVEHLYADALEGESYENASDALSSVEALQDFRAMLRDLPFGSFYEIIEEVSNAKKLQPSERDSLEYEEQFAAEMEKRAMQFSPRVADMYLALLAEARGGTYESKFETIAGKIAELSESGDLGVLFSPSVGWDMKLNRIETRLTGFLSGLRALDRREGLEMDDDVRAWREEELKKAPTRPPEHRNESKPGVDAMDRLKEGERAPAIWTIEPGFDTTKYFKEQSFSSWDSVRNVWREDEYRYANAESLPLCEREDPKTGRVNITLRATVAGGRWVSCPIPYTHGFHALETGGRRYFVQQDQNGDVVFLLDGDGEIDVTVMLAAKDDRRLCAEKPREPIVPDMPSQFTDETIAKLGEIRKKYRGNIQRAHALAAYARSRISYLSPKDKTEADRYNHAYASHPNGFAGAVDEIKQADCDVANTYFAVLCAHLDIPVRHAIGHSVKGRDAKGASSIHAGTGHGWSEVWDELRKEWLVIDATPAGDPNLEDDRERGGKRPLGYVAGDDIAQEAIRPDDEKLEALRKKLADRKEQLSYTKEERQLAEGAGVELKEARKIVKEIAEAESVRLSNGERVVDALSQLFNAIIESRKSVATMYEGPVRRREGGERIEDIIRHKIGMKAGQSDPLSREKPATEEREEQLIGGFDVYLIGDKSGSMSQTVAGEELWRMQRRTAYLIFSALHRFERNIERAGLQRENVLSIRTQGISFRGDDEDDIDCDKPLSPHFSTKDKVVLWHSLTEQGVGNGDVQALSYVYEQIKEEIEGQQKKSSPANRLRLVIACSDGGYVGDDAEKMQELSKMLFDLGAIVVGVGLTDSAANVPIVMHNPPHSRGDIVEEIDDLPIVVAKHIVSEAIKLFPIKARENARRIIEAALAKFEKIP